GDDLLGHLRIGVTAKSRQLYFITNSSDLIAGRYRPILQNTGKVVAMWLLEAMLRGMADARLWNR
ncbi:MAG: hypothetical protein KDK89_15580, partial [Alphaproteobacteria bacterium]|nr:hypothetical protein [Alphaproteobacteria bacterium]